MTSITQVIQNTGVTAMTVRVITAQAREVDVKLISAITKNLTVSIKIYCRKTILWFINENVKL
jgi:protein tyrosine phosphatase (PTP) superfamily phosphohydrolase (DUF442 family)